MSDNIILDRLREIRGLLGEIQAHTSDTRLRVGMLEAGCASVSVRLDRLAADVEDGRRPFTTQVTILLEKGIETLEREERKRRVG